MNLLKKNFLFYNNFNNILNYIKFKNYDKFNLQNWGWGRMLANDKHETSSESVSETLAGQGRVIAVSVTYEPWHCSQTHFFLIFFSGQECRAYAHLYRTCTGNVKASRHVDIVGLQQSSSI